MRRDRDDPGVRIREYAAVVEQLRGSERQADREALVAASLEHAGYLKSALPEDRLRDSLMLKAYVHAMVGYEKLGRPDDVVAAITWAVTCIDRMELSAPGYRDDYIARVLSLQLTVLITYKRVDEAIPVADRCVRYLEGPARSAPAETRARVVLALGGLSELLWEQERFAEILPRAQAAVRMARTLAAERPEAFTFIMAKMLCSLANTLGALKRFEESVAAIEEVLGLLDSALPADGKPQRGLRAWALSTAAELYLETGRHELARDFAEPSARLLDELCAEERENAWYASLLENHRQVLGRIEEHLRDAAAEP